MAAVPPRKAARGRQQDRLIVYLLFGGEAPLSTGDCVQAASKAAVTFYETPGTITAALRSAAGSINQYLHGRNQSRPAAAQYTVGLLALAVIRESQLTLLLSGPMQAYVIGSRGVQQISDPLSGRGLGLSETLPHHFSQLMPATERSAGPLPQAAVVVGLCPQGFHARRPWRRHDAD